MEKPKAIVTGMIANYAVGGVAWDYGQYAIGLEDLGFEVYYLEDTGTTVYDPTKGEYGDDCTFAVQFLERSLTSLSNSLGKRWRFINGDGGCYGIGDKEFKQILREAVIFLNVSNSALMRDEYLSCSRRVMIDTDPGLNHFHNFPRWDANPGWLNTHGWRAHTHFFTYAGRIGRSDCPLSDFGVDWHKTRPPVILREWQSDQPIGSKWTTVMTWKNFPKLIEHNGQSFGAKELEFPIIEEVPALSKAQFEVAVGGNEAPRKRWVDLGWCVRDSHEVTADLEVYRDYIFDSRGEFSVAKNVYVETRCGWFSCRTVCYLAAGRPAVVQDTGFSDLYPCGEGLIGFKTKTEALEAVEEMEEHLRHHELAARHLAERWFDANLVLGEILEITECPTPK